MNVKLTRGIAAAAVSAAMMLGAAVPALAADAKPIEGTTVPVKVTYSETGKGDAPEEEISYTPGEKSFTGNAYYNVESMPTVTISSVKVDADGTGAVKDTGDLIVNVPDDYKAVGVYTYNFSREAIKDAGVTDSVPTSLTVVVTVTNHIENGNVVEGKFDRYVVIKDANNKKYGDEAGVKLSYAAGQLTVTKKVTGNLGDQSDGNKFTFQISLKGPDGKLINGTYHYTVAGGEAKVVTFKDGKTTITEKLAHGQSIVFTDLPSGVTYGADEMNGDNKVEENGKVGSYTLKSKKYSDSAKRIDGTKDENDTVEFVNDYTDENIATGVLLNNAPYIAILGGAAVVTIYVVNKRRHSDMD